MPVHGEVLVAILNDPLDVNIAVERGWYRIPVRSVQKWLRTCWPPQWLAFYQTKSSGQRPYAVQRYAKVAGVRKVYRWEMFPDDPRDEKSERRYYQLFFDHLDDLPIPIISRRRRRIIFIPTTQEKFFNANEINDLYDESPLEDLLWMHMQRLQILAERQELVSIKKKNYFLDFAIYCGTGKLDIETDGDIWHIGAERSSVDNIRDNAIRKAGWTLLRFDSRQIREQMVEYCVPEIVEAIKSLGGIDEGGLVPRVIDLNAPEGSRQLGLFDNP